MSDLKQMIAESFRKVDPDEVKKRNEQLRLDWQEAMEVYREKAHKIREEMSIAQITGMCYVEFTPSPHPQVRSEFQFMWADVRIVRCPDEKKLSLFVGNLRVDELNSLMRQTYGFHGHFCRSRGDEVYWIWETR